jgi:hypothetical protein
MAGSLKALLILFIAVFMGACAGRLPEEAWPDEIPSRSWFVEQWQLDAANRQVQSETEFLLWVARFYEGFNVAPGWLHMMQQVNIRIAVEAKAGTNAELFDLGGRIGSEWAKDNGVRKINTRVVAVWRDALMEALTQNDLENFLARLQQDVDGLLSGELDPGQIQFERYYIDEFDL